LRIRERILRVAMLGRLSRLAMPNAPLCGGNCPREQPRLWTTSTRHNQQQPTFHSSFFHSFCTIDPQHPHPQPFIPSRNDLSQWNDPTLIHPTTRLGTTPLWTSQRPVYSTTAYHNHNPENMANNVNPTTVDDDDERKPRRENPLYVPLDHFAVLCAVYFHSVSLSLPLCTSPAAGVLSCLALSVP